MGRPIESMHVGDSQNARCARVAGLESSELARGRAPSQTPVWLGHCSNKPRDISPRKRNATVMACGWLAWRLMPQ